MKKMIRFVALLIIVVLALGVAPGAKAQGGLPVATVVCDQYLRSQPSSDSAALAVLNGDEPLMLVTGRNITGNWLVVLRQNGQFGWTMHTNCLNVQGNKDNAPLTAPAVYEGPPVATIGCTQYVRSEPDADSAKLLILYPEDGVLNIIGRADTSGWLLIQRSDGEMGWVYDTPCIRVQGDVLDAPVSDAVMPVPGPDGEIQPVLATELPTATIGCTQYIRSAPRNDAARLLILYPDDDVLEIIGRDRIGEWLLVRRSDGAMGWVVDTPCIVVQDNVFEAPIAIDVEMPVPGVSEGSVGMLLYPDQLLPEVESIVLPEPYAELACANYVRSAADNASARLAILHPGDGPLEILARDKPAAWLLVRWAGGMGWVVNTDCIAVTGNVFLAPEDTSVVMPIPGVTDGNLDAISGAVADSAFGALEPALPAVMLPEPYAQLVCANYVRSAADNASARLAILHPGDGPLEILARDKPAAWLLVRWAGGMGWVVNTDCIAVTGNVFLAPEDTSVVMPIPEVVPEEPLPFPGAVPPEGWPPQS